MLRLNAVTCSANGAENKCRCRVNRQWHSRPGNVRYRTYGARYGTTTRRYEVTITVDSDGTHLPNPAEIAVAAEQAASARAVSIVSAHTAARSSASSPSWPSSPTP